MSNYNVKLFLSRRTVLPNGIGPAVIVVSGEKIDEILTTNNETEINLYLQKYPNAQIFDFEDMVLMAGIVDSHVHVNEPGRTNWEGFWTATKAAAAGGVTTIIDMPLNAIPPTTTVENLKIKVKSAQSKLFVDVGFWGGVIPGNHNELKPLIEAGVVGFKCFMCPSGVDEFPHVNEDDIKKAMKEIQSSNSVLAFHAEINNKEASSCSNDFSENPFNYEAFLRTRPSSMEVDAIKNVIKLCETYNCRCHIVHLSSCEALELIEEAKKKCLPITAETCHHYLSLSAEKVPPKATQYKCCPPIRNESNKEKLWLGLKNGILDMVVSDHSPCTEELKADGNFLTSWGGISSVQFGLSLFWNQAKTRGFLIQDLSQFLSYSPAKLCGLEKRKGALKIGFDADFVVWNPDTTYEVKRGGIFHRNKLTPYLGEKLKGEVFATILRGNVIYKNGVFADQLTGKPLLQETFLNQL